MAVVAAARNFLPGGPDCRRYWIHRPFYSDAAMHADNGAGRAWRGCMARCASCATDRKDRLTVTYYSAWLSSRPYACAQVTWFPQRTTQNSLSSRLLHCAVHCYAKTIYSFLISSVSILAYERIKVLWKAYSEAKSAQKIKLKLWNQKESLLKMTSRKSTCNANEG